MLGGYMGKLLRVDLSSGTVKDEPLPEEKLRKYIGGIGLAARILYDEVPLDAKPYDPANRLIFMPGPLSGTPAPMSADCVVASLSGETGWTMGQGHSHHNFGSSMKFAGYDGIVIQGASEKPVYLFVNDGEAEIRDASKFWGRNTHDTNDALLEEVGKPEGSVVCIGPAGENMVHGASICAGLYSMSAKGGCGAVMGSKKLKAVVVWGTQGVPIADPDDMIDARVVWQKACMDGGGALFFYNGQTQKTWGILGGQEGLLGYKNFKDPGASGKEWGEPLAEMVNRSDLRPQGSFCCPFACGYRLVIPDEPHRGYVATMGGGGENIEGLAGMMCLSPADSFYITDMCDRMGMDSAAPGEGIAVLFELYEAGRITKEDTGGLELKWGDAKAVYKLLMQTAQRKGVGNIIADGPMAVAKHFNGLDVVIAMKGTHFLVHDFRGKWGTFFAWAVSGAGPCHEGTGPDWFPFTHLGYPMPMPGIGTEGKVEACRLAQISKQLSDSVGVCLFATASVDSSLDHVVRSIIAATGWKDFTKEEMWEAGERIVQLKRCFSLRRGHSPADDMDISRRLLEPPPSGPAKGKTIAPHFREMLTEFYAAIGWDPETGKPKEETLRALGLEQEIRDIADIEVSIKVQDVPPIPFEDYVEGEVDAQRGDEVGSHREEGASMELEEASVMELEEAELEEAEEEAES